MSHRASRALWIASSLSALIAGCVREDAPFASPASVSVIVKISPSTPTRISPPVLQAEGAPFEKDRDFRNVLWLVSGREHGGGERLGPETFLGRDRIRARGTVRLGGEESSFETPEVVVDISDGDGGKTVCTLTMNIHPRTSGLRGRTWELSFRGKEGDRGSGE